jgi:radical SAM protein (TIGR01212 family)
MQNTGKPYNDLNTYYRSLFGCRVQKITIDAGFSCPNRDGTLSRSGCIYCNANGSGNGFFKKGLSISQQLYQGNQMLFKRYKAKKYIAYFQSFSNTYAPVDRLKQVYDEALSVEDVIGLSIGTRPDCVDASVLNLLQSYTKDHIVWIEYGLQSAHDQTLSLINRGHDFDCFKKAVHATKNRGIKTCVHIILGLPDENKRLMLETARRIASLGIDGIKIHLLYVIKGTKLEDLYLSGSYTCLEQEDYAQLVCDFLELLPKNMIIHRLTGDPHPEELVAPLWSMKKKETLALINKTMKERDSWQGKFMLNHAPESIQL